MIGAKSGPPQFNALRDVVYYDSTASSSVVVPRNGTKSFLAGRVPQLDLERLGVRDPRSGDLGGWRGGREAEESGGEFDTCVMQNCKRIGSPDRAHSTRGRHEPIVCGDGSRTVTNGWGQRSADWPAYSCVQRLLRKWCIKHDFPTPESPARAEVGGVSSRPLSHGLAMPPAIQPCPKMDTITLSFHPGAARQPTSRRERTRAIRPPKRATRSSDCRATPRPSPGRDSPYLSE